MTWLAPTVASYVLFAAVALGDKYLLSRVLPRPSIYAFYVGITGGLVFLLVPFFGFPSIAFGRMLGALMSGAIFIFGLLFLYSGLQKFEASRVVPLVGGTVPLFTLLISVAAFPAAELIARKDAFAFLLLFAGTVLITYERGRHIPFASIGIAFAASLSFAISFVSIKQVYLLESFWAGFLWRSVGVAGAAGILFACFKEVRDDISSRFSGGRSLIGVKSDIAIFFANYATGLGAGVLQVYAIYLAPPLYVAFINALQGVQYVFLLLFSAVLSFLLPRVFQEVSSPQVFLLRFTAILCVSAGLAVLALL